MKLEPMNLEAVKAPLVGEYDKLRVIIPLASSNTHMHVFLNALGKITTMMSDATVSFQTYCKEPFPDLNTIGYKHNVVVSDKDVVNLIKSGLVYLNLTCSANGPNYHLLYAMACGRAIVTPKCGPTDSILKHGENCIFISEQQDEYSIADAILKITSDEEFASKLQQGAIDTFNKVMSGELIIDKSNIDPKLYKREDNMTISSDEKIRITCYQADFGGCGYYRCALPYEKLQELYPEYEVTRTIHMDKESLDRGHIILFQRQYYEKVFEGLKYCKKRGKVTLFEIDDYLHGIPAYNPCIKEYAPGSQALKNMTSFIKTVDCLTVSTEAMKKEYRNYNNNIQVLHNSIDEKYFEDMPPKKDDGFIRIGWAGSATHNDDIKIIIPVMEQIVKDFPQVKLVFIGTKYNNWLNVPEDRVEFHEGTYRKKEFADAKNITPDMINESCVVEYYEILKNASVDIAVAPLVVNRFNNAKSDIRLMDAGLCKIPSVASNGAEYMKFAKNSKGAIIATRYSEFYNGIKKLILNKQVREEMGQNAYDYVIKYRTTKDVVKQYDRLLKSLIQKKIGG